MSKITDRYRHIYQLLKKKLPAQSFPDMPDTLTVMTLCVLAGDGGFVKAARDMSRLFDEFIDLNEMRVARISEISRAIGGDILNGPVWERCRTVKKFLEEIFRRIGTMDVEKEFRELKPADFKKFLSKMESIDRDTITLIRSVVIETERSMPADKVSYSTAQALNLVVKGSTRYSIVKTALTAMTPDESFEMYCLFRALRDECRDPAGRFDVQKAREFIGEANPNTPSAPASQRKKATSKKMPAAKKGASPKKKPVAKKKAAPAKKKTKSAKPAPKKKPAVKKKSAGKKPAKKKKSATKKK